MFFDSSYQTRRHQIASYFDKTAVKAWEKLTSNEPVSKIRESVRFGREKMKTHLLSLLGDDLKGTSILDAGCGTGTLAIDVANKGAVVTAVDISPSLIKIAKSRAPDKFENNGSVEFVSGDMLESSFGDFDHIVLMDSIIHYRPKEAVQLINALGSKCRKSIVFTFAPFTPILGVLIWIGKLFPKKDRAPFLEPVSEKKLLNLIKQSLPEWKIGKIKRVTSGFYRSQAVELIRVK
jgi:magnesium-protoporphyrin O-methyltransferase